MPSNDVHSEELGKAIYGIVGSDSLVWRYDKQDTIKLLIKLFSTHTANAVREAANDILNTHATQPYQVFRDAVYAKYLPVDRIQSLNETTTQGKD